MITLFISEWDGRYDWLQTTAEHDIIWNMWAGDRGELFMCTLEQRMAVSCEICWSARPVQGRDPVPVWQTSNTNISLNIIIGQSNNINISISLLFIYGVRGTTETLFLYYYFFCIIRLKSRKSHSLIITGYAKKSRHAATVKFTNAILAVKKIKIDK